MISLQKELILIELHKDTINNTYMLNSRNISYNMWKWVFCGNTLANIFDDKQSIIYTLWVQFKMKNYVYVGEELLNNSICENQINVDRQCI